MSGHQTPFLIRCIPTLVTLLLSVCLGDGLARLLDDGLMAAMLVGVFALAGLVLLHPTCGSTHAG